MTFAKETMIDDIYKECDLSRSQATKAAETLLETIKKILESGKDVLITGFGKFCVKESAQREKSSDGRRADVGFHKLFFVDNIFNLPSSYAKAICEDLVTAGLRVSWRCILYPHTELARTAIKEGFISPDESLLFPKFFMKKGLDDCLGETISIWRKDRPHWLV